jgi:hypothetical protein
MKRAMTTATRSAKAALALAGVAAMILLPVAAQARSSIGFSFGVPLGPAPYYAPPPPPAYYPYHAPPPPVVYAPPPAIYAPPAPAAAPTSQEHCREYQSQGSFGGAPGVVYGTACLQPDGSRRIVR